MIHLHQTILFAADDWFQIVGGIIVMVMWGIQQIFAGRQEAKNARPKKVRQPRKPVVRPADGAQPPNQADPLRAEVEQFLRQSEEKKQQSQRPQQTRPREAQPVDAQRGRTQVPREPQQRPTRREPLPSGDPAPRQPRSSKPTVQATRKARKRPERGTPNDAASRDSATPIELRGENVEQHVARHLNTKEYDERADHLGEKVALADDRLEARLEQTFEHRLGTLSHSEDEVQEVGPTVADEVRELLSKPQGMRQLIVANEILRRPEDRW